RAGDVQQAVLKKKIGEEITLEIWRSGKTRQIKLSTAEQPHQINPWLSLIQQLPQSAPFFSTSPSPTPSPTPFPKDSPNPPSTPFGFRFREANPNELAAASDPPPTAGIYVVDVEPNSPAATAGLRSGDIITHADHQPISNAKDFERLLSTPPQEGRGRLLIILRDGRQTFAIFR
ncbi:MAG: PDZ domain-containing protein, partial [Chthoniobacterales bacterium]|nr:PDZ domain-containing protein [Chthoniobacterales bacterium]